MRKFEYMARGVHENNEDAILKELGAQGWELCAVVRLSNQMTGMYFKRESVPKPTLGGPHTEDLDPQYRI